MALPITTSYAANTLTAAVRVLSDLPTWWEACAVTGPTNADRREQALSRIVVGSGGLILDGTGLPRQFTPCTGGDQQPIGAPLASIELAEGPAETQGNGVGRWNRSGTLALHLWLAQAEARHPAEDYLVAIDQVETIREAFREASVQSGTAPGLPRFFSTRLAVPPCLPAPGSTFRRAWYSLTTFTWQTP